MLLSPLFSFPIFFFLGELSFSHKERMYDALCQKHIYENSN